MALPWQEKWLYLSAALWLLVVKAGLYLLPFDQMRRWVVGFGQSNGKLTNAQEMQTIIQAIERISQFLSSLRINCLPQALVGYMLLCRKGFDVQLKIGVLKNPSDQLIAHAWLEYQGQVILGNLWHLGRFTSFPSPLNVARQ
jgi:hypothetical protein